MIIIDKQLVAFACSCNGQIGPSTHCEACHPRFSKWRAEIQAECDRTGIVPKTPAYANPGELTTEQEFILRGMVKLARQIRGNGQFRRILRKIDPAEREALYNTLKPHLSFKAWPYSSINF